MEVGLGILREIEVDDDVDALDIDTSREEIRCHKMTSTSVAEFMEDTVSVGLLHLSVDVEATVA